jgi:hypothetical protein
MYPAGLDPMETYVVVLENAREDQVLDRHALLALRRRGDRPLHEAGVSFARMEYLTLSTP